VLRTQRGNFRAIVAVSAFINLLAVAVPVFVLQVYDRVVAHAGLATLYGLVVGMGLVLVFDFLLRQARARTLQDIALRIDVAVGRRLMDKLLSVPLRALERRPSAFWLALQRDVEAVRNLFSGATAVIMVDLPFAVLFAGVIVVIAPPIAWVLVVLIPAFVALGWLSGRLVTRASDDERRAGLARDAMLAEMASGWDTVKGLALDESLRASWEERHGATLRLAMARGARADSFLNAGLVLGMSSTVLITAVGAMAILDQRLTIGALIAANMLASRIVAPFQQVTMLWRSFAGTRQAMARLDEVFALAGERTEAPVRLDRPAGRLLLDGVSFAYDEDGPPLIRDLRLNIEPNGLYGLVGANGSGKTTLLKLILGLYAPLDGRILIDGIDIGQLGRADRAAWFGYTPQESHLFAGTIRDNIARGESGMPDDRVVAAARRAGVHADIVALPDGYGTPVAERGGNLSAGMRQRIALARALVFDPVVLLLDEPSAHLDRDGERALTETLAGLSRGRTVIAATHSPALLAACNSLLVLEGGRAKWAGKPADILPRLFADAAPAPAPKRAPS